MDIHLMRKSIMEDYPNDVWKRRVSRMPDSQVIAIFYRKCLDKGLKAKKEPTPRQRKDPAPRQLSLFDKEY